MHYLESKIHVAAIEWFGFNYQTFGRSGSNQLMVTGIPNFRSDNKILFQYVIWAYTLISKTVCGFGETELAFQYAENALASGVLPRSFSPSVRKYTRRVKFRGGSIVLEYSRVDSRSRSKFRHFPCKFGKFAQTKLPRRCERSMRIPSVSPPSPFFFRSPFLFAPLRVSALSSLYALPDLVRSGFRCERGV